MTHPGEFLSECGDITRRIVVESGCVATTVADEIDTDSCGTHDCVAAIGRLFGIGVRGSVELARAALAPCAPVGSCGCGPAAPCAPTGSCAPTGHRDVRSGDFATNIVNSQRELTIAISLSSGYIVIPNDRVTFYPSGGRDTQRGPLGVLGPGEPTFSITVDATGLPSAVYVGTVRVHPLANASEENVTVYIEL
jgi:hypothetical protein